MFVIYPSVEGAGDKVLIKGRVFKTGSVPDLRRIQQNPEGLKGWETRGPFTLPEAKAKVIKASNKQKKAGRQLRVIRGF